MVAEWLGYPPETAVTLGRFVAGSSARAKARRLGMSEALVHFGGLRGMVGCPSIPGASDAPW